jgi:ribosomal protein S18 acetylase RimI-like enzyme
MDEITIRRATIDDALLLSRLGARLFENTFGAANHPDDMRDYLRSAFSLESQHAALEDPAVVAFIAEDAGHAAIGYAVMKRGSRAAGVTGAKPVEVQRIYSDHAWHGRGVGALLMHACIEQAHTWHGDELWLGVWENNPRAIAFYEKTGFRVVGRQSFQLGRDLQQDLVMSRVITRSEATRDLAV